VPLLFGGLGLEPGDSPNSYNYTNRAFLLRPDGEDKHYDKLHLVPFGEYVPFRKLLFFVDKITDAIRGDITPGASTKPLDINGISVGVQICYEIIFSEPSRAFANNGASVIVNITNDAWFGHTAASAQHMMSLPFRAVENRVPIIRAANTGVSGFVTAVGTIKKTTPLFETLWISESITVPPTQDTFYKRFGDLFAYLCIAVTGAGIYLSMQRKKSPPHWPDDTIE
jgi:apolipoprotein N-acyltransferase